jgi:Rad3-related DNA helicase
MKKSANPVPGAERNPDEETLPPPFVFGFPEKYEGWRTGQESAISTVLEAPHRYVSLACPTGFGKSLVYVAAAVLNGGRALILTSTKGLQSQLRNDFGGMEDLGMVDVRGKNAYRCRAEGDEVTCDQGPCNLKARCSYRASGCRYYDRVRAAKRANLVVTNYHFWMFQQGYGGGIGHFDMLVCDEAHEAPEVVASYLSLEFKRDNPACRRILPDDRGERSLDDWREWARYWTKILEPELESLQTEGTPNRETTRKAMRLESVVRKLKRLESIPRTEDDEWVAQYGGSGLTVSPVWPGKHTASMLWPEESVGRVVLTSATVRPKTLELLGLKEDDYVFREYPHPFPVRNRMLTHIPTVRVNHRCGEPEMRQWVSRIDQIIDKRKDRRGLVHTISYDRKDRLMVQARNREIMVGHGRREVEKAVARFRGGDPPKVLVSPSVGTGWDFAYDECRYQIIGKLAYPDTRDPIVKARSQVDKEYTGYLAMQQLVQMCGRAVRADDDWCENFIVDDNIGWFMKRNGRFAPKWFRDGVQSSRMVPQPPPLDDEEE